MVGATQRRGMSDLITTQQNLVDALENEIEDEEQNAAAMSATETPEGCKFVVKEETPTSVTFVHDLGGETITVKCNINDVDTHSADEDEDELDEDEQDAENEQDNDEEFGQTDHGAVCEISLEKPNGSKVYIHATAWSNAGFEVESIKFGAGEDAYDGPNLRELEEELQNGLMDYIEARGLNDEFAMFLSQLVWSKEMSAYSGWLKDFKAYVSPKV